MNLLEFFGWQFSPFLYLTLATTFVVKETQIYLIVVTKSFCLRLEADPGTHYCVIPGKHFILRVREQFGHKTAREIVMATGILKIRRLELFEYINEDDVVKYDYCFVFDCRLVVCGRDFSDILKKRHGRGGNKFE